MRRSSRSVYFLEFCLGDLAISGLWRSSTASVMPTSSGASHWRAKLSTVAKSMRGCSSVPAATRRRPSDRVVGSLLSIFRATFLSRRVCRPRPWLRRNPSGIFRSEAGLAFFGADLVEPFLHLKTTAFRTEYINSGRRTRHAKSEPDCIACASQCSLRICLTRMFGEGAGRYTRGGCAPQSYPKMSSPRSTSLRARVSICQSKSLNCSTVSPASFTIPPIVSAFTGLCRGIVMKCVPSVMTTCWP